jgi:hypothetical protein
MITLKQWMEVVGYRITEGSDFQWECYGEFCYSLDSWNGDQDGHSFSVYFDTKTQEVYEVQAHDYRNQRAYRLISPAYATANREEAEQRRIDAKEAWEGVDYVDLETAEDYLEKAEAIEAEEDYDTRVSIPLNLPEETLFVLMQEAHKQDLTLNQLFENILKEEIDRHERNRTVHPAS